jgi:hypothetical protein
MKFPESERLRQIADHNYKAAAQSCHPLSQDRHVGAVKSEGAGVPQVP